MTKSLIAADSAHRANASGSSTYNGNWAQSNTVDSLIQTLSNAFAPSASSVVCTGVYISGVLTPVSAPAGLPSENMWPNNHGSSVQIVTSTGASDVVGVIVRSTTQDSSQNYYTYFVFGGAGVVGAGQAVLRRYVNGTQFDLQTASGFTYNIGDIIELDAVGSNLTGSINGGTAILAAVDTNLSGGSPGILLNQSSTSASVKNWKGYNLNGLSGPPVVFLGDSYIARWNLSSQFVNANICNCGVGGETTSEMLTRFTDDVINLNPTSVIIESSFNGLALGTETSAQTLSNVGTMAAAARAAGIKPYFTTMTQRTTSGVSNPSTFASDVDSYNSQLATVVHAGEVVFDWNKAIDFQTTPTTVNTANYITDQIHPNSTGYTLLGTTLDSVFGFNMPLSFTQASSVSGTASSTQAKAYGSNTTLGSLLIAACAWQGTGNAFVSLMDTLGNTWVQIGSTQAFTFAGLPFNLGLFYVASNKSGGANTVTLTVHDVAANIKVGVAEYTGQAASNPLDTFAVNTAASGTANSVGPLTTLQTNEQIIAVPAIAVTYTAGVESTGRTGFATGSMLLEDQFQASVGSYSSTATSGASNGWAMISAAFKTVGSVNPWSISGSAGTAGATITWSGTASGTTTADGSGNYTIPNLANGSYTITPSKTGFTFAPTSSNQTVSGANITGINFTASSGSSVYSVPDCRTAPFGPNASRTVQGTKIYDVQTSDNAAVPGTDSRSVVPADSRVSPNIPQNSRAPGTFGPGE